MKPAPRRWKVADSEPLPGLHPVVSRVLAGRGHDLESARTYLGGGGELHDPLGLNGMAAAVIAVGVAVTEGHRIAIYGDYDADGVTACALLSRALDAAGADVIPYIPNRMTEGYGLHAAALEELAAQGVRCVVTVDCGTSSVEVARTRPEGMTLIITDHHLPLAPDGSAPQLAPADALVNPKQPGDTYPFDGLAGAGVAWKLLCALEAEGIVPPGQSEALVGLAALGTVCDMMPLRGENRSIVARGLERVTALPGLRALCEVAGVDAAVRCSDLGFAIGPRINAAGRMEDAKLALELCLTDAPEEAERLALALNQQNLQRQQAVALALEDAEARMADYPEDAAAIVLGDPGWPMGIVGLVAGRLMERYGRPTFIVCLDAGEAKGSARSVRGVHIVRALDHAAPTLLRYGGHAAAAGFSMTADNFAEFALLIEEACAEQLGDAPRERVFAIDGEITCADTTPELCDAIAEMEPCGMGNPQPMLMIRDCEVLSTSAFGAEKQHIRLALGDGGGGILEAIAFHKPQLAQHLPRGRRIDACFALEKDVWQGQVRVRARLRDVRPAQPAQPPAPVPMPPLHVPEPVLASA